MLISTVEKLKSALTSMTIAGIKPEYMVKENPQTIIAAVNVDTNKIGELTKSLPDLEVEVTQRYPIKRTADVKVSLKIQEDWLLESVLEQSIPTISVKL